MTEENKRKFPKKPIAYTQFDPENDVLAGIDKVWEPQPGSQALFLTCPIFEVLYEGTRGPGKRIYNEHKILTDTGWKKVKDVTYSDKLVAPDGTYTDILGIFPHTPQKLYKVIFDEGQEIYCGPEHLWSTLCPTNGPRDGWVTRDTEYLYHKIKKLKLQNSRKHFQTPRTQPIPGKKWLGIDPYIIGLLIGDGNYSNKNAVIYTIEPETIDLLSGNSDWQVKKYNNQNTYMCYAIGETRKQIKNILVNSKGSNKYIPKALLDADPASRLALLQGLIDTDGCIDTEGRVTYSSISEQLMKDIQYLVRSLGGKMTYTKSTSNRGDSHILGQGYIFRSVLTIPNNMLVSRLQRKIKRQKIKTKNLHRAIVDIQEATFKGSATCFSVAHPSHQFIIEDFVVTHNTDALLMDFLQHVGMGFGAEWRGILFRRAHPELTDVINKSQKWFKRIFPTAVYNKVEKTWTFPEGEQLLFRHIKTVDDYWTYHGHAYPWIAWEELTNWPDDAAYRKMMSCSRSTNPLMPRKYRSTCNPYGVGHNWVKRRFRLPSHRGIVIRDARDSEDELEPPRVAIHGNIYENQILLKADPGYIAKLRAAARNPSELKAWLKGDWDIVAGGMFDDVWNPKKLVVEPFKIPGTWRVDRSFDWGSARPFSVGWWAESDGSPIVYPNGHVVNTVRGDLFRIHEWYGCDTREHNTGIKLSATQIAIGIIERDTMLKQNGIISTMVYAGPADTSIWDSEPGKPSIADDMQKKGVYWEKADKSSGSRKQGWQQIRKRLEDGAKPSPREEPGLFIFRNCHYWTDLVPILPRSDKDLDDVDTDAEDHIGDETRYRVRFNKRGIQQRSM